MHVSDIEKICKDSKDIYILGHFNPDGDCLGATLALAMILSKRGIQTRVLLKDIPSTYDFLDFRKWVSEKIPNKIDIAIVLDCGDLSRLGDFRKSVEDSKVIINIDHHMSNASFGHYNHVLPDASSTSEIIYDMIEDFSLMDLEIARMLYTGIIYDTGVFKHSCTTYKTHHIAGNLIRFGFDFTSIINRLFYSKSISGLRVQGKAIENLQFYLDNKVAVTYLTRNEIQALNATKKDSEGIVQMLGEIEKIECSIFAYETDLNEHKISLRSNGKVDVCEIAKRFDGGGHKKASGFSYEGHFSTLIQKLTQFVNEQL